MGGSRDRRRSDDAGSPGGRVRRTLIVKVGDRVAALMRVGASAEVVPVPTHLVQPLPDTLSFDEGACLLAGALTPPVAGTFPFERTAEALAVVDERRVLGKVVLRPTAVPAG